MNLIIDIGNTRTKVGVFDKDRLIRKQTWTTWDLKILKAFLKKNKISNVAVSTVQPVRKKVDAYLKKHYFYIFLNARTPLPIKNRYKTPETLGKDRLAAVVGAYDSELASSTLVIDAGTCIKYDLISEKGHYLGGNISPGIYMRYQGMHTFTAQLPLLDRKAVRSLVGNTTETAMRTGVQLGALLEMEGFIKRYEERFGEINVILTGGDANYFAKHLKTKIFVNHNLVLIGLNKILNYNVQLLE